MIENLQNDVDKDFLEIAFEDHVRFGFDKEYSFTTHKNQYHLNFDTMWQKNVHYQTQRAVRRRPKYLKISERQQLARYLL